MSPTIGSIEFSDPEVLALKPLVSVCIFAYKHERFIADAIEGVIRQVCSFPIELIIGEDCSPDRTLEIALNYQKRYPKLIRVLTGDINIGGHANVARCHNVCRGKYIALCDGDDFWHEPNKLKMQVELMESNPDMTFCHTDFDRKTRFRTWRDKHRNHPTPWLARGDAYKALLYDWSVMTVTALFRASVLTAFNDTEFNNLNWPFGDRNRILFASLEGQVGYIDQSTATYRKARNSSLNSGASSHLNMPLAAEACIEMFLSKHPIAREDERRIRSRLKKNIYQAAFYAERSDLMQSSHEWLCETGFRQSPMLHKTCMTVVRLRFPVHMLRAIKDFIDLHISSIPA